MRTFAVALLLLAAVVYVLTKPYDDGWVGFVNSGAEAAMIGAIADWFAVTALFKHPLGLPIPHTALVPRRKAELGEGLQSFVGEHFLSEEVVRDRVSNAGISRRIADWLADPRHVDRVVAEAAEIVSTGLGKVTDEHVSDLVSEALLPRFREEPLAPVLGSLVTEMVRDDLHRPIVDLGLEELHRWLLHNPVRFGEVLSERAPRWAPPWLNEAVTTKIHTEALRWLADIRDDPQHHARTAFDSLLAQLGHDLLFDDATRARAEAFKERLLDHPQVAASAVALWQALRRSLLASLADPEGAVRARVRTELTAFAERLDVDPELRDTLDSAASDLAWFVVERYGTEFASVIGATIERWDGREAAERIELHVGRDLQFIRINGTLVGGLVGVIIHGLSLLFLGH